jgi:hypothetical protein
MWIRRPGALRVPPGFVVSKGRLHPECRARYPMIATPFVGRLDKLTNTRHPDLRTLRPKDKIIRAGE